MTAAASFNPQQAHNLVNRGVIYTQFLTLTWISRFYID
jgi:hypothetical protein